MSTSMKGSQHSKYGEQIENENLSSQQLLKEKEVILGVQVRKLHEMRNAQVAFFDSKMMELRERELAVNRGLEDLHRKEIELDMKRKFLEELIERLRIERDEIGAIKELLRTETESVQIQTRDLHRIVQRYEKYLVPMTSKSSGVVSR
jgi:hypothetical protein